MIRCDECQFERPDYIPECPMCLMIGQEVSEGLQKQVHEVVEQLNQKLEAGILNTPSNVVLIRPRQDAVTHEQKLVTQATFLRELAEAIENSNDVEQAAFAFVLKMKDGSTVVQSSGWADDARAQSYFLTFSRNHGWPA